MGPTERDPLEEEFLRTKKSSQNIVVTGVSDI